MSQRQSARAITRIGKRIKLTYEVDVSTGGLLSIAAMVCGILLSTSVLVAVAKRGDR